MLSIVSLLKITKFGPKDAKLNVTHALIVMRIPIDPALHASQ